MSIEVEHLSHIYNQGMPTQYTALDDVSFSARRGEIVSLLGHTGSGKSTLAMHLNGLIIPQGGRVIVDGIEIAEKSPDLRRVRHIVGFVFQYPEQQIFAETVEKEISFAPANWGKSGAELKESVENAMRAVGLESSLLSASPFELSGGQKRRVAIASVLAADPQYLVLDEPAAGLDAKGSRELIALLDDFKRGGKTAIHITHDIDLALLISDRIYVLEEGRIAASGTPREIAEKLCVTETKGLILPDILRLSFELKEAGMIRDISWSAPELAALIEEAR